MVRAAALPGLAGPRRRPAPLRPAAPKELRSQRVVPNFNLAHGRKISLNSDDHRRASCRHPSDDRTVPAAGFAKVPAVACSLEVGRKSACPGPPQARAELHTWDQAIAVIWPLRRNGRDGGTRPHVFPQDPRQGVRSSSRSQRSSTAPTICENSDGRAKCAVAP